MFRAEILEPTFDLVDYEREVFSNLKSFVDSFSYIDNLRNKKIPDKKRDQVEESLNESAHWYNLAVKALISIEDEKAVTKFWNGLISQLQRVGLNLDQVELIRQTILRLASAQNLLREKWSQADLQCLKVEGLNFVSINLQKNYEQSVRKSPLRTGRTGALVVEVENLELETPKIIFEKGGKTIMVSVIDSDNNASSIQLGNNEVPGSEKRFYLAIDAKSYDQQTGLLKIKEIRQAILAQLEALIND